MRGKFGAMQQLNIWELVVGDVVILHAGDKVPSDCIAIEAVNLEVQESYGNMLAIIKKDERDPFLRADSYILKGHVRAFVACVGFQSTREATESLELREDTPLQIKLENLSGSFTYIGLWAAIAILIASLVTLSLQTAVNSEVGTSTFIGKFVNSLVLAVVILLVAIPEGLPVTVGISLAYSLNNMFNKDKILVRQLDSIEKMGEVSSFILGKTGTLTSENMTVTSFFVEPKKAKMMQNNRHNTLSECQCPRNVRQLIQESIIYNNSAHVEITDDSFYVPVGNGTEVSLLKWLQKADIPVHKLIGIKDSASALAQLEFNSNLKFSMIAIKHNNEVVRVYAKGAPEVILSHCSKQFDEHGDEISFSQQEKQDFLDNEMTEQAAQGLRCIAFSFIDLPAAEFETIQQNTYNFNTVDKFNELFRGSDHTFVSMVMLCDELRCGVKVAIETAQNDGGVNVILVSGDNLETAKHIAINSGIIHAESLARCKVGESNEIAMTAEELIRIVGIQEVTNDEGRINLLPQDQSKFDELIQTLKVVGRAQPVHKQIIAAGLQETGKKVAVIGEGISDLNAFATADVSFAMGSGKSIARNKASFVLLDDNFQACIKALCRGRNIYSNVKRFLQFQISVNFSVLVCVFVGVIVF